MNYCNANNKVHNLFLLINNMLFIGLESSILNHTYIDDLPYVFIYVFTILANLCSNIFYKKLHLKKIHLSDIN